MSETMANFPYIYITKTSPDTFMEHPKINSEITYLEKKNIYEVILQKLRKKDVYEPDMYKIYNLILGLTNN